MDWTAEYFENMVQMPVPSQIEPNWLEDSLPTSVPATGVDFADVLKDVNNLILPAVTHWIHPNFHGLFSTSTSSVGLFLRNAVRRVRHESDALAHVAGFNRTRTDRP